MNASEQSTVSLDRKTTVQQSGTGILELRSLLDAVAESAFLVDLEGTIVFANRTAGIRLQCTSESLVGRPILDLVPPDVGNCRLSFAEQVLETGTAVQFEDERAGIHFINYIHPVFDDSGRITHLAIFSRDITEQHLGREELGKLSMLNRVLLKNIPDLVITLDRNGTVLAINHPIGNREISTMIGKPLYPFLREENREPARTLVKGVFETGEAREFVKYANLSEGHRWVDVRLIPIAGKQKTTAVTCIIRDITEMKEYEKRLEHKNAAMSELIEHMKEEKREIHRKIEQGIENRILPLMEKIKIRLHSPEYAEIVERLLKEIVPGSESKTSLLDFNLTPREQEICAMIKHGLSTKEIASLSNCSHQTVEKQRKTIRRKLGLSEKSENLTSYLQRLA